MSGEDTAMVAVLESRAGDQLRKLVERLGVTVLHAPALAELPDIDHAALREWIEQWETVDQALVIFQTGVGVEALFQAMNDMGLLPAFTALLARSTVAVRGPKPTAALRKRQVRIDVSAASPFTSETLLQALGALPLMRRVVYVQRHGGQNPELMQGLEACGARVTQITAYRWGLPQDRQPLARLLAALAHAQVDTMVFTSASQIYNLLAYAQSQGERESCLRAIGATQVLSVGPVCSEALRAQGIAVAGEADPPKLGPLMQLLENHLRARGKLL